MAYIDWEYYNTNFPGLEKEQFEAILPAAEMTVDIKTHFRSRDAAGYKLGQVRACVANVVNALAQQEETGAGKGIASVSNDGYSESYTNTTREQADRELTSVCRKWLSGTGLMGAM